MPKASGSRVELAYKVEVTPGTTPAPLESGWSAIRKNSESVVGSQNVIQSGEIRADRQNASDIQGNKNVGGGIETELSDLSHDALIASALFNPWVTTDTGATSLSAVASTNSIDRAAGSFVTDGFIAGQWVLVSGFATAANNGFFKVTSVSATSLVVVGTTIVDEAAGGDEQVAGQYLKGGVAPQYLSIRKAYRDIDKAVIFDGCLVSEYGLTIAPDAVIGETFTINGQNETLMTGTGATGAGTAASDVSTASPMDSFSGKVLLDNVENATLTSINLTLNNNIDDLFVVGSRFKIDQSPGRQDISGDLGFYFDTLAEYSASVAHTSKSIDITSSDGTNYFGVSLPRVYYDLETPSAGGEGAMPMTGPFRARYDSTVDASIILSRSL